MEDRLKFLTVAVITLGVTASVFAVSKRPAEKVVELITAKDSPSLKTTIKSFQDGNILGVVDNTGDIDYRKVEVHISLYAKDESLIGDAVAFRRYLDSGDKWAFTAKSPVGDNYERYRLCHVIGYVEEAR